MRAAYLSFLILMTMTGSVTAQQPGIMTGSAVGVTVNGKPATRAGDATSDGQLVEGSSNVFINGKPAAIVGGRTDCGGTVVSGSSNVFINGKPIARRGDATSGCAGR